MVVLTPARYAPASRDIAGTALFVAEILPSGLFVTSTDGHTERRNCVFEEVDEGSHLSISIIAYGGRLAGRRVGEAISFWGIF